MRPLRRTRPACSARRARAARRSPAGEPPDTRRCEVWPGAARDRNRLTEEVELRIPQWQHTVEFGGDVCTVALSGELDMAVGDDLAAVLAAAAGRDPAAAVQVDLSWVTFVDCSTITVLVDACRAVRTQGRRFSVRGATGRVHDTLSLTGVLAHLSE